MNHFSFFPTFLPLIINTLLLVLKFLNGFHNVNISYAFLV